MLGDKFLRDELNKFAKYVIQQSRSNLTKGKKNTSKELYNSLGFKVSQSAKQTSLAFEMADYGKFQDKGVRGANAYYADAATSGSPYAYKSKGGKRGLKGMPPPKAFDKWIVRKGLDGTRDKSGKFISRKSLQFLIARSVFDKGIRASLFFTKPFEAAFKRLPDELVEAYSIGLEKQIQVNIKK